MRSAVLVLLLGLAWSGAEANGGVPRLVKTEAGPYLLSAWTQPDPPRVGALHVSVVLMDAGSEEPVLDGDGEVRAERVDGEGAAVRAALDRGAGTNLLAYHAELAIPAPGRWRVTARLAGPLGETSAGFDVEVLAARAWGVWLIAAVVLALASAGLWLARRRNPPGRG